MIKVENVYKSFGEKEVLKDISVTFNRGQCNTIIGASGSGKSVLMKCMVGLIDISAGHVYYEDRDFSIMNYEAKKTIRREIGMLFQGGALFDSLTVEENVSFPLKMFTNMSEEEKRDRVNACLAKVKLENVNHLFPSAISGGMQKRVGIARAIALNPRYLFCDEPNSGLDPLTSRVIDDLIREITEEFDITTIINTHDMKSVFDMGDNIVFIYEGHMGWNGRREEINTADNKNLSRFVKASMI